MKVIITKILLARSEWNSEEYIQVTGVLDGICLVADGWALNTITDGTSCIHSKTILHEHFKMFL
jgi:hypothetical protein